MSDAVILRLEEEETTTPGNIIRIGSFAAIAFLFMAFLVGKEGRAVPLVIGGLIVAMLLVVGAWLAYQSRFGAATLKATTPFRWGGRFEGVIETELPTPPIRAVTIRVFGWAARRVVFDVQDVVTPSQFRRNDAGAVEIPFSIAIPQTDLVSNATAVRFAVRTSTWPIGWGATFLIVNPM